MATYRTLLSLILTVMVVLIAPAADAGPIVECGEADAPECDGFCPEGECVPTIVEVGVTSALDAPCRCRISPEPCGIAPECGGSCGPGEVCRPPVGSATGGATTQGINGPLECYCQPSSGDFGDPCETSDDCAAGFCVDDVCCNSACDGEDQQCDLAGLEGQCAASPQPAPAPSTSTVGLVVCAGLLLLLARIALPRRRHDRA